MREGVWEGGRERETCTSTVTDNKVLCAVKALVKGRRNVVFVGSTRETFMRSDLPQRKSCTISSDCLLS